MEAWKRSTGLIKEFKVRPNPVDLQGGIEAIGDGLEFMKVSLDRICVCLI